MRLSVLLLLLTHLGITGWLIPGLVGRSAWAETQPRLGLRALHSAAAAHLVGLLVLGALAAHDAIERAMIWLVHADKNLLHEAYAGERRFDLAWDFALVLVAGVVVALVWSAWREARRVRAVRADHCILRTVVPAPRPEVTVLDGSEPAVWCIPGPRFGRIFVTTAALDVLTPGELDAAIEHERAHLARRHHRMVFAADSVASVFGRFGALRTYPALVRHLVELDADDVALRSAPRRVLASALLHLGEALGPDTRSLALAMNGSSTGRRIRRLLAQRDDSRRNCLTAPSVLVASVSVLLLPVAVVLVPAFSVAGSGH